MNDAISQIKPKMINFSAAEPSRKRLYAKLLARAEHINPDYIGYIMGDNEEGTEFLMVKKDVAEKVNEAARANGVEMTPILTWI